MLPFAGSCRNPWAGVRYTRRNGIVSGDRKEGEGEKRRELNKEKYKLGTKLN